MLSKYYASWVGQHSDQNAYAGESSGNMHAITVHTYTRRTNFEQGWAKVLLTGMQRNFKY